MAERLQKILSQWGIASRRQAEQLILAGRVRLNGAVVQLGQMADPAVDAIEVDGSLIQPENRPERLYLLLHKPMGVVSTCHDPQGRTTVLDLLPRSLRSQSGLHPVGRLDADSTGALLLTNDGEMTVQFTHPRHSIPKIYRVWVKGQPTKAAIQQWRQGVRLEGRQTRPAAIQVLKSEPGKTLLEVELKEGRNRQIRKVAELLGCPVIQLHRVAIDNIQLGDLASGEYRSLTPAEVKFLKLQARSQADQSRRQPNDKHRERVIVRAR